MLNHAFEAVGPLAFDPVHHIAAIGGAERAGVADVELRILLPRRGEAEFQVFERLAAPILVDAVGKGLTVAGRAVEIDGADAIALLGIKARVPESRPAVAEARKRPSLNSSH